MEILWSFTRFHVVPNLTLFLLWNTQDIFWNGFGHFWLEQKQLRHSSKHLLLCCAEESYTYGTSAFSFWVNCLYKRSHHSASMRVGCVWHTFWEPVNSKCGIQTDIVPQRRERDVWVDQRGFVWSGIIQMHYVESALSADSVYAPPPSPPELYIPASAQMFIGDTSFVCTLYILFS